MKKPAKKQVTCDSNIVATILAKVTANSIKGLLFLLVAVFVISLEEKIHISSWPRFLATSLIVGCLWTLLQWLVFDRKECQ